MPALVTSALKVAVCPAFRLNPGSALMVTVGDNIGNTSNKIGNELLVSLLLHWALDISWHITTSPSLGA
jgi:hypothetical protein